MKVTMKIDQEVKADLERIAGQIQAKTGGSVTLSDAVHYLIKEHREKERSG